MFDDDADYDRADYALLQNGAVNLFWDRTVLDDARQALARLGYDEAVITCDAGWSGVHGQFTSVLEWHHQFGYAPWTGNLNAFHDALRGYPFGPSRRCALVLSAFHALVREDRLASEAVLDMLEYHARNHLLWGKVLVVLVQTDDRLFEGPMVGGRQAGWNRREWLASSRGL